MLQDAQRTSAPRALRVLISTAVCIVICSEPAMRAPRSGCSAANSSRMAIRPGISVSAIAISLRPQSAKDRSATRKSSEDLDCSTALITRSFRLGKKFVSAVASCDHLSLAGPLSAEGFELLVATLLREL